MCNKILIFISSLYPFSKNISRKVYKTFEWLFAILSSIIILNGNVNFIKFFLMGLILLSPISLNIYCREKISNNVKLLICLAIVLEIYFLILLF